MNAPVLLETPALTGRVVARSALDRVTVEALCALLAEHYDGVTEAGFRRDLATKDWVVLLSDAAGAVQGFTSFALYRSQAGGDPVAVVYSGDTVVRPAHWGTPALPRTWIHAVLAQGATRPEPLWWLLISSGYKTYRFLTVFFEEYFPRHDRPTPSAAAQLMQALAAERFGSDYDPSAGVVRLGARATPLRPGPADITPRRLQDPHVAFFAERNPGHVAGDELVCLARLDSDNFTPAGRRMAR